MQSSKEQQGEIRKPSSVINAQCKVIEGNNGMGKTRDLFKKIEDTKGTFHAKMGTIKDRNGMDLTEAEDIKTRWQEYTEELYKKDLHDPDNHDGPEEENVKFYITSCSFCLCNSACSLQSLDHVGHVVYKSGNLQY